MYELTRTGMESLHGSAKDLMVTGGILSVFLSRFSEFVALDPESDAAAPRGKRRKS